MKEQRNNGRGIFYGIIGVATLVVAIIGATFAYFTATQTTGQNEITGNMATITFSLSVSREVDPGATTGIIPMSNTMVEQAVTNASDKGICVDDNGNAVCQIYKITVQNGSTAAMFVDGYVALNGGSGVPTDYLNKDGDDADTNPDSYDATTMKNSTTMRWAQVFPTTIEDEDVYSTGGIQTLATGVTVTMTAIGADTNADSLGFNRANILDAAADINGTSTINNSTYANVKTNYIRISDHTLEGEGEVKTLSTSFNRTADLTSMLVLSQQLQPNNNATGGADEATYYFVVWLSETGTNQTAGAVGSDGSTALPGVPAAPGTDFFDGVVTFNSAQGSEVTATFNGYTAVTPDTKQQTT